MAGLFLLFIVAVAVCDMVGGFTKTQDEVDGSDCPPLIVFTPDDDAREWENSPQK